MTITTPADHRHAFGLTNLTSEGHAAKQATRERTLALIKESEYWSTDNYLNGDWIELCGEGDETLAMLLATDSLREGRSRYVGVNLDQSVLDANALKYKDATERGLAVWVHGKWADVLEDTTAFPRCRVLVFDGFNSLANFKRDAILAPSYAFAEAQYKRAGAVLLVLNFSTRQAEKGSRRGHVEDVRAWKESVCRGNHTLFASETYTSKVQPMVITWSPLGF